MASTTRPKTRRGDEAVTIRDAKAADLPAIVAIYNAAVPNRLATADLDPVTVQGKRAWFDAHRPTTRPIWVAETGGEIVGWLSFQSFYGRPAYSRTAELSIYIATADQRRGVGHALLTEAVRRAPELHLTALVGFIFGHNAPSLGLFEALGFTRWGHLPGIALLDGVERDLVIVGLRVGEG